MKRIRTNNRLIDDLRDISDAPVYMGYFTIPALLIMIGGGYAEFTMKDRVKITNSGEAKIRELGGPGI